jgi:hypothetical protein
MCSVIGQAREPASTSVGPYGVGDRWRNSSLCCAQNKAAAAVTGNRTTAMVSGAAQLVNSQMPCKSPSIAERSPPIAKFVTPKSPNCPTKSVVSVAAVVFGPMTSTVTGAFNGQRSSRQMRPGVPHPRAGQHGWCNGCDGRGFYRPPEESYYLEPDDVREFIGFLRACGGFRIC